MLALRSALDAREHSQRSERVQRRFLALDCFVASASVALYAPLRGEVATDLVFRVACRSGKHVYFPRSEPRARALSFFRVDDPGLLKPGRYGLWEPEDEGERMPTASIDLVVLP